jgi:hypothetical protein
VKPLSLQIAAGKSATFSVSDPGGCVTFITATSSNSRIATVSPGSATAVTQIFTVVGVTAGSARISVFWEPVDHHCGDMGTERVEVSVTAAAPDIVIASLPRGLAQETNMAGGQEQFTLANLGNAPSAVTLTRAGTFTGYEVTPATAELPPGGAQVFTIRGTPQPQGFYEGRIEVAGPGVPQGTSVPVRLVSANRPSAPPRPRPVSNRVDVAGDEGQPQRGTVSFTNDGAGTVRGVFSSDVPWIVPPAGVFQFNGNSTASVDFEIDLARRPPDTAATGNLSLQYLLSPLGKMGWDQVEATDSTGVSTTLVTIVSTKTKPPVDATLTALAPGQIALFAPGVGRVRGNAGLYISDLSITSLSRFNDAGEVKIFFTPIAQATRSVSLASVSRTLASPIGDIVASAFRSDQQLGGLQIRSADAESLGVAANIFIADNERGSFGTAIPIFRSDRGTGPGGRLIVTGLEKTASVYANFYIQETSGNAARVKGTWLGATGAALGSSTVDLAPFGVTFLSDPLPPGAVAAVFQHEGASAGAFSAYAAGLDRRSEDFWAIPDWANYFAWNGSEPLIFPIAGSTPGANNTNFRTDLSLSNGGAGPATAALRYRGTISATGAPIIVDKTVQLSGGETQRFVDVTRSLFGIQDFTIGYFTMAAESPEVRGTSRTYNFVPENSSTYGTAVPSIPLSAAIRTGGLRRIGGIDESALTTILEQRPATFRSNLILVETEGLPVRVRVTMHYRVPSALVTQVGAAAREYQLEPNQFLFIQRIADNILGTLRTSIGDLRNVQLDIEVVDGGGAVVPFVTTVDNGTGDSILRTQ